MPDDPAPPQATILIPLRRQQDTYLERCVRSALDQTVACEVIVVVAADTPDSNLRTLNKFCEVSPQLKVIIRDRDNFAAAFNTGIAHAAADRVGFLMSDDWLEPTAVEECLVHGADLVSTDIEFYDAGGSTKLNFRTPRTAERFDRLPTLLDKADYLSMFYLFRKSALTAVGGVDESIGQTGADDLDLIWCLLENGATVSIIEKRLYNCRDHDGERLTLRDPELQIRDLNKIFDKHNLVGPEREKMVRRHARWYGKTLLDAVTEMRSPGGDKSGS